MKKKKRESLKHFSPTRDPEFRGSKNTDQKALNAKIQQKPAQTQNGRDN